MQHSYFDSVELLLRRSLGLSESAKTPVIDVKPAPPATGPIPSAQPENPFGGDMPNFGGADMPNWADIKAQMKDVAPDVDFDTPPSQFKGGKAGEHDEL